MAKPEKNPHHRGRGPGKGNRFAKPTQQELQADDGQELRLNRYIARAGVCSRRDADNLISAGSVSVNGQVITELGTKILPTAEVLVNGKRIGRAKFEYILLNKPGDTITTVSDEKGRRTVMDQLEGIELENAGLFPVGRLDRHTIGVLLITNDGVLAHRLTHPSYEIEKVYRVRARKPLEDNDIQELKAGIELEDGLATLDRIERLTGSDGREVGISIHEGRNRQIRRMFEKIGHNVQRLERVRYAGLTTKGVRSGKWRRLTPDEIAQLYKRVKL